MSPMRPNSTPPASNTDGASQLQSKAETLAHIEQVRLLILGMEQRLQAREDKLVKTVERAEAEGAKFDQMRKHVLSPKS